MIDLSDAARALLEAGANHKNGICCLPGQVQKNWTDLRALERAGYIRWLDMEQPWITAKGRAAIGAPGEYAIARLHPLLKRKPLEPKPSDDPRTDFDYRSYKAADYLCTLVVRQPDYRTAPSTIRVGKSLTSEPQFLGARNSIVQPESEGRFVLTLVPAWMIRKNIFSAYPWSLDENDPAFAAEERELWARLRDVCISINTRIRLGSSRPAQARSMAYGQNA